MKKGGTTSVGFALMTSACSPRHSDHEWKAVVQVSTFRNWTIKLNRFSDA